MRRFSSIALVASVAACIVSGALTWANSGVRHASEASWNGFGEWATWSAGMLTACVVGWLVATRRPGNREGPVLSAGGLAGMIALVADGFAGYALFTHPSSVPGGTAARIVSFVAFAQTWAVAGVLVPALFPDGRPASGRWRPVTWAGVVAGAAYACSVLDPLAFDPPDAPLGNVPNVVNPVGIAGAGGLVRAVSGAGLLLLFAAMFGAVASLVVRAARAPGEQRQQIKVVAYSAAVTIVVLLSLANTNRYTTGVPVLGSVVLAIQRWLFLAIPASLGVALLRYRLYDVDRLISRTISWAVLTALLAAVYAAVVFGIGSVAGRGSNLAIAGATLLVAAAFRPFHARVRATIDRRFDRSRYDASLTIEGFSASVRDLTDLETLGAALHDVARRTLRPSRLTLWLRG